MSMSMIDHAKRELDLLVKNPEDELDEALKDNLLQCVEKFTEFGHSGGSVGWAIGVLTRLLKQEDLTPLTGEDSEWIDVSSYVVDGLEKFLYQNNRFSSVFKENNDAYWLDGYLYENQNGYRFTKRKSITFPFVPIYPDVIYVIEKEDGLKYLKSDESVCVDV